MLIEIKNRWTGTVLLSGDFADVKSLIAANLGADLTNANLTDANLTSANLRRANLTDANLTDANLTSANLRRANLRRANLTNANLTRADLTRADLTRADLTRADLRRANLDFASWPLWCGSTKAILDDRLKAQLLYHALCLVGESVEIPQAMKDFVNTNFHRVGELPKL